MAAARLSCRIKRRTTFSDEHLLSAQCRAGSTIAVAAVIAFEDVCDDATRASIPVSDEQTCTVIEVGTAGKPQDGQLLWQWIALFQGINQHRLLPVAQELRVDTNFFCQFDRLLEDVALELPELQLFDVESKRFDLSSQFHTLIPVLASSCVSWMLEPLDRIAGFFRFTATAR